MFQVDDIIIYGSHGVCQVTAVGKIPISYADKEQLYYTLKPLYRQETVLYAPIDNEKVIMRPIVSREEAQKLIDAIPDIESAWVLNEKEREQQYKQALHTCDCRELVRMIKTLYQRKKSRVSNGKKVTIVDERYFRKAEEQLYEELSYALELEKEQVGPYIVSCIDNTAQEA